MSRAHRLTVWDKVSTSPEVTPAPVLLTCGHPATPQEPGSISTGYGTKSNGDKVCLSCAFKFEQSAFWRATRYTGYVSSDGTTFTTWTGGVLAIMDWGWSTQDGQVRHTPTGGEYKRYHWTAHDNDGGQWYGDNGGPGMVVTMRKRHVCEYEILGDRSVSYCGHPADAVRDDGHFLCAAHLELLARWQIDPRMYIKGRFFPLTTKGKVIVNRALAFATV